MSLNDSLAAQATPRQPRGPSEIQAVVGVRTPPSLARGLPKQASGSTGGLGGEGRRGDRALRAASRSRAGALAEDVTDHSREVPAASEVALQQDVDQALSSSSIPAGGHVSTRPRLTDKFGHLP